MTRQYVVTLPSGGTVETDYDPAGRFEEGATWMAVDSEAAKTEWLIDIGPFFDRFETAKMAVLTSADATVRAIVQDVTVRKWIDLKRDDVGQALDVLIAKNLIGAADKTRILNSPVQPEENLALRKTYFH